VKHSLVFIAILLLGSVAPALANEKSVVSTPSAQDQTPAATTGKRGTRRATSLRRRSIRRPCRRVVVAAPKGLAITTTSGLTYMVTRRSQERQPLPGETVMVNYTGLLGSGVKFDSSLDRGQPIEFPLGKGRVIKGWDEGIAKLRIGEQATLIIPPQLGYAERGAGGVIPPNATLIFLVELVGIKEQPKVTP